MERLTFRDSNGNVHATRVGYYDIIDKLEQYEELEEKVLEDTGADIASMVGEYMHYYNLQKENRLLELPCKVGDVVYWITWKGVVKRYVASMDLIRTKHVIIKLQPLGLDDELYPYSTIAYIEQFGREIFLTKAEAEKALAEMEK